MLAYEKLFFIICTGFSDLMPSGMEGATGVRDVLARTVRRVLDEKPV
jgi:hypothetical protein